MSSAVVARNTPTLTPLTTSDDAILADTALWDIVSSGDLKGLSPKQRADYYHYRCRSEGLNPASQPFTYLTLNGKGVLYANKSAADQLRKVHGVSVVDLTFSDDGEYLTYEVTMEDRTGRRDVDVGQVFIGNAKGEQRANARMKAITKAKRRATYSICGTGVLDETEVETILGAPPPPVYVVGTAEEVDNDTGEIIETESRVIYPPPPEPLTLNDDIKRLRTLLRWEATDVIERAAREKINLQTDDGKRLMVDLLQTLVEPDDDDEEPGEVPWDAESMPLIDAPSRPAGEPGLDRYAQ